MKHLRFALLGGLALGALATPPASAQSIGAVEDVISVAFATPPSPANRTRVILRYGVVSNELLETERGAAVGVKFVDDTVFRLGSDSRVRLDRFIYNPRATSGELTITLGRGAFRYISGQMPKDGVRIVTPSATIGIRGTDFVVIVGAAGDTRLLPCDRTDVLIRPNNLPNTTVITAGQGATVTNANSPVVVADGPQCDRAAFIGAFGADAQINQPPQPPGPPDNIIDITTNLPPFVPPFFPPPSFGD
jgi:hypothetical protein